MKVLFLDIDGVLTSARAHASLMPKGFQGLIWHHFDPIAIGMLNRLAEENEDLYFVLSSSWRKIWNQQTMTMFLSVAGWKGQWHSNWKTPDLNKPRGEEIDAWVREHKPDRFIIIDDDPSILDCQYRHWVKTDEQDGMNSLSHFQKAKEALKVKYK